MIDIIKLKAQELLFRIEQSKSLSEDEMKILQSDDKMKAAIDYLAKQSENILNGNGWPNKNDLLNDFITKGGKTDEENKRMA